MYKEKYLKYKTKYLDLKIQLGGASNIIKDRGGLSNFNLFGPSKKQKAVAAEKMAVEKAMAAEKAVAEKVAAEKAAAEKAIADKAAAEKAANEKTIADKAAAEINNIIKSSKTFANAYKGQNSNSRKLHFYFYVNNWYTVSKTINGKRKKSENKNNVISFDQYFIYDNMNIYMSNKEYSPVQYNEYFSTKLNINTFFTNFIELLIYIDLLKKNMTLLNGDNIDKFLKYLLPIRSRIKFIFNIDLSEDDIKSNYKEYNLSKDKYVIETYTCGYQFFIDGKEFNVNTTDIKTDLGLDATVKSMAMANFAKTKAAMETTFIKGAEIEKDICDKNPNLYDCRDPKRNLNTEFNQIMGIIPEK